MPESPTSTGPIDEHPAPARTDAVIEQLSRRFRRPLQRFFEKRIGRQADTEDLVQHVFLRLASGGRVEQSASVEGYLFKIANNLLRDRQRRMAVRNSTAHEPYEDDTHGAQLGTPSPERLVQSSQLIEQMIAALHELPERTREAFTLYHLHGLSHAQIASRLGIAVSTLEKHMTRACAHLLKRIDP
jgi:RNA polymerase sigma-70 factor (ECF subfamily)